jgi:hypothetical protein
VNAEGLACTEDELRSSSSFSWLTPVRLRRMRETAPGSGAFGESFLWAALFRH